jgi:2',3'-cyclic-nucleotide 2'-phosphodiesterase (5'-nucleotidase family)
LLGCSQNIVKLTIISTSDFHGALESARKDPQTGQPLGGAVSLAKAIKLERSTNPGGTIYLDGGDSLAGTALSNFSKGRAVVELMNIIGLDAAAVGNHEFDFGVDELVARIGEANYPILGANIVTKPGGVAPEWVKPYAIFDLHGVRVGVIGLATVSTPITTMPSNVKDLGFLDPAAVVNRLIDQLIPSQADIVVVVGHIGVFSRSGESTIRGELLEMARRVDGVAALVGGHTHQLFSGVLAGIPAVEAAHSGTHLGRIDLAYNTKKKRIRSGRSSTVRVLAEPSDQNPEIEALIAKYNESVADLVQEVIAEAETDIVQSRRSESAMANLITDGWRSQVQTDFVFQNPGGIRDSLAAGPITYEDLYRVLPFDNTIVALRLSGAEIEELLIQGARATGHLEVSGLRYTIDNSQDPAKITITEPQIETDRLYRVSVNSFMAEGGDGLSILKNRPEAVDTGLALRDMVAAWLRAETAAGRKIAPHFDDRVQIIAN